ncbi:MAG: bifunctional phosphopantothenoylcysteine decarboxylase/phosphopantothenate--cysteine ligase CoaBC [Castellaniella sp.]
MTELADRHLILGLTGGIACYKMAEYIRRAREQGATIDVIMTEAAGHFITATTLQALSGRPVWTSQWDERPGNAMAHINLARQADAILVAPATANFIAHQTQGLADDLLNTLCVARGHCPLLVAPAMNREMWLHPATQRNIAQLGADGVTILGPASGEQACGETGDGRMLEAHELLDATITFFQPKRLAGRHVLITAGPTMEAMDPVRVLTNRSSGKMGYALARAAQQAGARVSLVSGPTALPTPAGVQRTDVESAREMHAAVMARVKDADIFIGVAAVADWCILEPAREKLKKDASGTPPEIRFGPNPDILAEVAALPDAPYCMGFAAETDDLYAHAHAKRLRKKVPLLVGNLAQEAMNANDTRLVVFSDGPVREFARMPKMAAARALIDVLADAFAGASATSRRS